MRFSHQQAVAIALYLATNIGVAYTSNIYAFNTKRSLQVGAQDPDTGKIIHSGCNSIDTPVFPIRSPNVLRTFSTPRNGTALAAAGWWDGTKVLASIFFQNIDGDIANCFYVCNMSSGQFVRTGESYPSRLARVDSVHEKSGLSVQLLGEEDGYRLFYHNADMQVMMISLKPDTKIWVDSGTVSPDTSLGLALQSTYRPDQDISVAFPRGSRDVEVARLAKDNLWQLETFPRPLNGSATNETTPSRIKFNETLIPEFVLPYWDPDTPAIGHSVTKHGLRELYYIGTDKTLYQARESDIDGKWTLGPNGSQSTWPRADERRGGLAIVSAPNASGEVWIYYWVDGAMMQAHKSDSDVWDSASALPVNLTDHEKPDDRGKDVRPSSWSTEAKAGVGVGISVGALLAVVSIWFLVHRRAALHSGPGIQAKGVGSGSHSDLPEVCIVQRVEPIAVQSTESSAEQRPVELEQPAAVHELVGQPGQ
ncbi:hypothetical protein NM208_g1186 [Fusarium decemcellulare]|uniref:Uncharacterized protein n=1 Tax=Fusarium decemcellulare TaxID=57161 RepID=A0ACC1SX79_9HYPO|nr:hypothetical protein NM208_g1186 [Fusarium decemcellulare]